MLSRRIRHDANEHAATRMDHVDRRAALNEVRVSARRFDFDVAVLSAGARAIVFRAVFALNVISIDVSPAVFIEDAVVLPGDESSRDCAPLPAQRCWLREWWSE